MREKDYDFDASFPRKRAAAERNPTSFMMKEKELV